MVSDTRSPSLFWAERYSRLLASHPVGDFPAETLAQAQLILADTLAAIAAGAQLEEIRPLARHVAMKDGPATLFGSGGLTARPEDAAFFNAVAGTASEMDEGHYPAGGHPGIHAVPAALATAEALGASGLALIDAIIVGYEAAARIGLATKLRPSVHSHGTWGVVGAAVATARLKKFDAARMHKAITIAAGLATATSRTSPMAGANVRHIYAGMACKNGVLACFLAENGFDGEANAVEITFGELLGSFDAHADSRRWGEDWEISRNYFKFAASCKDTQGSLEALAAVASRRPGGLLADAVRSIHIDTFADAVSMSEPRTGSTIAARFSIPFVLATKLVRGSASVWDFGAEARADARIIDLANRVTVSEEPAFTAKVPLSLTRITVELADGTRLTEETEGSLGDYDKPLDAALHEHKFASLVKGVWRDPEGIRALCSRIAGEPDMRLLGRLTHECSVQEVDAEI